MSEQRVRHVKELAQRWVEEGITPALVFIVARRGAVVLHEAFGRLTPEPDSPPLARDTIFPLASLTKPVTATAVMTLVDDGLLGLNRPVSVYIPEFVGDGKEAVLVHHLLSHTSGLQENDVDAHAEAKTGTVEIPDPGENQHARIHEDLYVRYDAPLSRPPGEHMSYSTLGYELLGEIVRRLSGSSLADYARQRIFAPLGMDDTYYIVPGSAKRRVVRRHSDAVGYPFIDSEEFMATPGAGYGAYSTAMDMAVLGQMFLNGGSYGDVRILSPATVSKMTRNQIPGIGGGGLKGEGVEFHAEASWGYGWGIHGQEEWSDYPGTLQSPEAFSHSGTGGIYFWADPVYDLVGAHFCVALEHHRNHDLFVNAVTAAVDD